MHGAELRLSCAFTKPPPHQDSYLNNKIQEIFYVKVTSSKNVIIH
jgi:hypothetical protein